MSREKFEEALKKHKDNLTRSMIDGGEGGRVNSLLRDIDSNEVYFEYYFMQAWQEQQKFVDELEARMAEADKLIDAAANDGTECVEIWALYKAMRGEP